MPRYEILLPDPTDHNGGRYRGGRNKAITEEVLEKLRQAFMYGASDEEACAYAEISAATLYNHQKANPEFLEWKNHLKQNPFMLARKTIVDHLNKDPEFALKYMERKRKAEFSPRTEVTGAGGAPIYPDKLEDDEAVNLDDIFSMHTKAKADDERAAEQRAQQQD